jgi:hypothetical protein
MGRVVNLSGKLVDALSLGAGASTLPDLDVAGCRRLWLFARLSGTVTVGDLVVSALRPWVPGDEVTVNVLISGMLVVEGGSISAVVVGSNIEAGGRFYVEGLSKLRIPFTNNNAASKTLDAWYILEKSAV